MIYPTVFEGKVLYPADFYFLKPGYLHLMSFILRFDGVNSIKYYALWNWYCLIKTLISVCNILILYKENVIRLRSKSS